MICETCPLNRKPAQPLSRRQAEIVRFIGAYHGKHGVAPSYDEMATALGVKSLSTIAEHIANLERKGWITREWQEQRGRALTPAAVAWLIEHGETNGNG